MLYLTTFLSNKALHITRALCYLAISRSLHGRNGFNYCNVYTITLSEFTCAHNVNLDCHAEKY